VIRVKSNPQLSKVALVFQIILVVLTFLIGFLIGLLFSIRGSGIYIYNEGLFATLAVVLGVGFVCAIEVGVIVWQTHYLSKKNPARVGVRTSGRRI
jgi:hypothetical protein